MTEEQKRKHRGSQKEWKKRNPWYGSFESARARCIKKTDIGYGRYGGRGIKFNLTIEGIKDLWFRDKAFKMERPSIDRINNDGDYEYSNCRFIELKVNVSKRTDGWYKRRLLYGKTGRKA